MFFDLQDHDYELYYIITIDLTIDKMIIEILDTPARVRQLGGLKQKQIIECPIPKFNFLNISLLTQKIRLYSSIY